MEKLQREVGLDLGDLFQPKLFCDSVSLYACSALDLQENTSVPAELIIQILA